MPVGTRSSAALRLFPEETARLLGMCIGSAGTVYEIRLYTDKAVMLCTENGMRFCQKNGAVASFPGEAVLVPDKTLVWSVVSAAAAHAPFLHERELKKAYLTVFGCRVAVCGFSSDGKRFSSGISSVAIRLPYSVNDYVLPQECAALLESSKGVLIAGAPACGKTTLLKKCAFMLSGYGFGWKRVCVIDERDEFYEDMESASGAVTVDLIRGETKEHGIQTALRLFSPEYIVCDEIGGCGETEGMLEGMNSGVRFIASIHAADIEELKRRRQFRLLWNEGVFEHIVLLSSVRKGQPRHIYERGDPGLN